MRVKGRDFPKQRGVEFGRRALGAAKPGEQSVVRKVHQGFEFGDLRRVEPIKLRIDESAEKQVHLPHAATPGADADLAPTNVEIAQSLIMRLRRPGHIPLYIGWRLRKLRQNAAHCARRIKPA